MYTQEWSTFFTSLVYYMCQTWGQKMSEIYKNLRFSLLLTVLLNASDMKSIDQKFLTAGCKKVIGPFYNK